MGFNLLYALEPITKLFPNVTQPATLIGLHEKTIYTAMALFIYLICCQIPLYGIIRTQNSDPLYWTRVILASSRGTLMELGISPIISAGWMLQLMGIFGFFKANMSVKRDVRIYEGLEKLLALIMAFGQIVGQIYYGSYGPIETLGVSGILLILAQLMFSAVIVILLDDVLQSGYGLGSGISLFIVANTAENIIWQMFSPVTLSSEFGVQFQGSFLCLIHFLLTKNPKTAIIQSFTRSSASNLISLTGTIFIFFVVIYLRGFRMSIPLIRQDSRGYVYNYKIKLFYTSTISIILQSMVSSKIYQLSKLLANRLPNVFVVRILGSWDGQRVTGGIAYWISPPEDAMSYFSLRGLTYTIFVCLLSALFAQFWMVTSKRRPRDIAKQLRNQELTLKNFRKQSVYEVLSKNIPTAAMLGGITIGLLTIIGDMLNVIGSSTGILLSINIIYSYYDQLNNEKSKTIVEYY